MTIEIRIGGSAWPIRPLTIRQQIGVQKALFSDENIVARGIAIVKAALERDHKAAADGLDDHEGTVKEIDDAAGSILRLGGWLPAVDG
jgi:hypothetical protein